MKIIRLLPAACLLLLCAAPALAAMKWATLAAESSMSFSSGGVEANVIAFDPAVTFDPEDLSGSRITIAADLSQAFLPPAHLDADLRAALAMGRNPGVVPQDAPGAAVFTGHNIRRLSRNAFSMTGMLSINGREKPAEAAFTATMAPDEGGMKLVLDGSFSFNPADYAGGELSNPGTGTIAVSFSLHEVPG